MKKETNATMETLVNKYQFIVDRWVDTYHFCYNSFIDKEDIKQQGLLILIENLNLVKDILYKWDESTTIAYLDDNVSKELKRYIDNISNYLNRKVRNNSLSYVLEMRNQQLFKESEKKLDKEKLFKALYADGPVNVEILTTRLIRHLLNHVTDENKDCITIANVGIDPDALAEIIVELLLS